MTNGDLQQGTILVLGGTGKTGRKVADRLIQAGRDVRIGSRRAEPSFDWEDRASWGPALQGVSATYIAYQPDLAVPGALETVEAEQAERALQATSADWTILRSSWFSQNFSENFFLDAILSGEVALPVGSTAEPFVDTDDIADIALAAFTGPGHSRQLYDITGPRALSFADAVGEIARATGRAIAFVPVSPADYRAELERQGLPEDVIALVLYLLTTVLDGRNTPVADGVQRALGRPARDFSDYVRRTAATGVWGRSHD